MQLVGLSFISIIQDLLASILDTVLAPVLRDVFDIIVNLIVSMISEVLSNLLLQVWIIFLKLIYFVEEIFKIFAGITVVKMEDVSESYTLLELFFHLDTFQQAFWAITVVSMALAFFTTTIAVLKSISSMALENRSPISTALRQGFQAALTFVLVPVCCLFALQLTTQLTVVLYEQMQAIAADSYDGNVSMSDTLFITVAQEGTSNSATIAAYSCNQRYTDPEAVKADFDITQFNYILAYTSSILVALILLVCILQFIQRIMIVLILYIVSPFFTAYIPLDGGAKFREWRNMFVGHMISSFGPIIMMNLYLMLVPTLVGKITYSANSYTQMCCELFVVLGGAFAVFKGKNLFISLINPTIAMQVNQSGVVAGMMGSAATSIAFGAVGSIGKIAALTKGSKAAGAAGKAAGAMAGGSGNASMGMGGGTSGFLDPSSPESQQLFTGK